MLKIPKVRKKLVEKILQNDISVLNNDTHINDVIDISIPKYLRIFLKKQKIKIMHVE